MWMKRRGQECWPMAKLHSVSRRHFFPCLPTPGLISGVQRMNSRSREAVKLPEECIFVLASGTELMASLDPS